MTASEKLARQKRNLKIMIAVLAIGGLAIAGLATRVPLPLRLFLAATDLVAAAFFTVAIQQASAKK
jgi:hypothetical protein